MPGQPKESKSSKARRTKGLADKAFGEASEKFGKEIAPLGSEAGQVARNLAHELLRTVGGLVWGYKQIQDWIETKVSEKIGDIPPENLAEPDPRVAGPAIEAMRFAGDSEEIQNLFAQLIASDMNLSTKKEVHPAFVDIIKQMSPIDARVFRKLATERSHVLGTVTIREDPKSPTHKAVVAFTTLKLEQALTLPVILRSFDNLTRLGVVEITSSYPVRPELEDAFKTFEQSKPFEVLLSRFPNSKIKTERQGIYVTQLGAAFAMSCLKVEVPGRAGVFPF